MSNDTDKELVARLREFNDTLVDGMWKRMTVASLEAIERLSVEVEDLEKHQLWAEENNSGLACAMSSMRAELDRAEAEVERLKGALKALHDDCAEYQRINRLGGYDNRVMVQARSALRGEE